MSIELNKYSKNCNYCGYIESLTEKECKDLLRDISNKLIDLGNDGYGFEVVQVHAGGDHFEWGLFDSDGELIGHGDTIAEVLLHDHN